MRRQPSLTAITVTLLTLALPLAEARAQAPISASGQPAESEPWSVNVELVVNTLPEKAQTKAASELQRQLGAFAEEHDLVVVEREAATLFIRLELNLPDPTVDVFFVDVIAVYGDEVLLRQNAQACIQCTPAEMVHDGLAVLPSALTEIERRRAEAAAAAAQAEAESEEAPPAAPPPSVSPQKLGVAGYVGISSSVLGLGSAIAGSVLLARGKVDSPGGNFQYINYQPPGKALIGVGLGMMVVGTVLLAVDLSVLEERRRATARAKLDSVSLATMNGPGIVVSGRF